MKIFNIKNIELFLQKNKFIKLNNSYNYLNK